jgi:hypothetical protein
MVGIYYYVCISSISKSYLQLATGGWHIRNGNLLLATSGWQ